MGLLKKASIAAAVLAPVLGLSAMHVANADTGPSDIVSVTGIGNTSPALPSTGCAVSPHVTFAGTATFTPTSDDANLSGGAFTFNGTGSACASVAQDSGSGTLGGVVSGNVTFTRTGSEVQVSGTVTLNGEPHTIIANCEFVWTDFNPSQGFDMACQAALNS